MKIEREYLPFNELSEEIKAEVLDMYRYDFVNDDFWYEFLVDEFKKKMSKIGVYVENLYFDMGFSQSDYANFDGKIADYDLFLPSMSLSEWEQRAARFLFENDYIKIRWDSSTYRHSTNTHVESENPHYYYVDTYGKNGLYYAYPTHRQAKYYDKMQDLINKITDYAESVAREFTHSFLKALENEYLFQTSDEVVSENLIANEYLFNVETGEML